MVEHGLWDITHGDAEEDCADSHPNTVNSDKDAAVPHRHRFRQRVNAARSGRVITAFERLCSSDSNHRSDRSEDAAVVAQIAWNIVTSVYGARVDAVFGTSEAAQGEADSNEGETIGYSISAAFYHTSVALVSHNNSPCTAKHVAIIVFAVIESLYGYPDFASRSLDDNAECLRILQRVHEACYDPEIQMLPRLLPLLWRQARRSVDDTSIDVSAPSELYVQQKCQGNLDTLRPLMASSLIREQGLNLHVPLFEHLDVDYWPF